MAPQIDYTKYIFLPFVRYHFGIGAYSLDIRKRGYFPRGGGEVHFSLVPLSGPTQKLSSISLLDRGKVKRIAGIAHYGGLPNSVGNEMIAGAEKRLASAGYGNIRGSTQLTGHVPEGEAPMVSIQRLQEPRGLTTGPGSGIVLWAELEGGGMIGGSAIGSKKKSPELVGQEAADELIKGLNDGGCVDEVSQTNVKNFWGGRI